MLIYTASGCKTTSETERPQMCTVVSVSGEARYWDGQSNKVHTIRRGDRIPQDSTIQTANGAVIYLATGTRFLNEYSYRPPFFDPPDKVTIYEDSVLKLSKVTLKTVGENRIPDTRLQLLRGAALLDARTKSSAQVPKGEINAPYHEIRGSNVVVRAEHAGIWFSASGITRVLLGNATIERTDQGITKDLSAWQAYDPVTGEISPIEQNYETYSDYFGGGDGILPPTPWVPAYQVPQRVF